VPGRAQPGRVEQPLHLLLVPERQGLRHGQAAQAELLAQPGGQQHVRLPQALHPVDPDARGQPGHHRGHLVAVGQRAGLDVVRQGVPRHRRQRAGVLVAQADHVGARVAQPAGEEPHLGRIAGRDHQHVHRATSVGVGIVRVSPARRGRC
jgi:hypothetical protein